MSPWRYSKYLCSISAFISTGKALWPFLTDSLSCRKSAEDTWWVPSLVVWAPLLTSTFGVTSEEKRSGLAGCVSWILSCHWWCDWKKVTWPCLSSNKKWRTWARRETKFWFCIYLFTLLLNFDWRYGCRHWWGQMHISSFWSFCFSVQITNTASPLV